MKSLMIEQMNKEKQMYEGVKSLFAPYMNEELADLKTNEVMRITGYSFTQMSADDICPYCTEVKDENGSCQCDDSQPTLTIQQALEVWDDACKDLLKDIAQVFLDKSNQAKSDKLRDADVFQAVGESIENFPLRDKRTYFLYKFGVDIDKM
ncbi:MAG TPA: hypothetical protein PKV73_01315 [Agriterribacter sp.]|nr:hypothetical protein [Agriterribacter sp.]